MSISGESGPPPMLRNWLEKETTEEEGKGGQMMFCVLAVVDEDMGVPISFGRFVPLVVCLSTFDLGHSSQLDGNKVDDSFVGCILYLTSYRRRDKEKKRGCEGEGANRNLECSRRMSPASCARPPRLRCRGTTNYAGLSVDVSFARKQGYRYMMTANVDTRRVLRTECHPLRIGRGSGMGIGISISTSIWAACQLSSPKS